MVAVLILMGSFDSSVNWIIKADDSRVDKRIEGWTKLKREIYAYDNLVVWSDFEI